MLFWIRWYFIALALAVLTNPSSSLAAPTMFVKESREGSWEHNLILVPNAKEEAGVSVDAVNAFIKKRLTTRAVQSPIENFIPICLMNFAHAQDVVSSDRKTQSEIRSDLEEYPRSFADDYISGNERFIVRVGIFEECNSENSVMGPLKFMALVVTDQMGTIREFDALYWNFIRIFKRSDGIINLFGCFACGEVVELRYNPSDQEFYYKWIGH